MTHNEAPLFNRPVGGSHSGVAKDSSLQGCDAVSLVEQLPTFRRIAVPSSSRPSSGCSSWTAWPGRWRHVGQTHIHWHGVTRRRYKSRSQQQFRYELNTNFPICLTKFPLKLQIHIPVLRRRHYVPCSWYSLVQFHLIKDNGKQVILEKGTRLTRRRKAGVNLPMYGICVWLGSVEFL